MACLEETTLVDQTSLSQSLPGNSHHEATPIQKWFTGQNLFITGGTGFIGKVIIEKLLRSCPDIGKIYMLVRPKRGQGPQERVDEILDSELFKLCKQSNPNYREPIHPISGDMTEPNLGMTAEDRELITKDCTIVIHSAATVRFNDKLKISLHINVLGVQKIMTLCNEMTNLQALVHVSTAYANCDKPHIRESIYPQNQHPRKILDTLEWMDEDLVEALVPKILGDLPNSYTYTKAMAENLLLEEFKSIPLAIVRPSIVGASWKEPVPGWVDNYNGPTGILTAVGKGFLRVMKGSESATADLLPVDVAANMIISACWATATDRPKNAVVYNCTTGQINRLTWGDIERCILPLYHKHPLENIVRIPKAKFTSNKLWHDLKSFFDQQLPAYFLDFCMWLTGRRPMFVKICDRITNSVGVLDFFTSNQWEFSNENVYVLMKKMTERDLEMFDFDVRKIDWSEYLEDYVLGTKTFMLKEDMSKIALARAAFKRLKRWNRVIKLAVCVLLWRLLVHRVKIFRSMWYFILQLALKFINNIPGFAKS